MIRLTPADHREKNAPEITINHLVARVAHQRESGHLTREEYDALVLILEDARKRERR